MQRLLIIKLSSLGDIVHALPVATALRRQFPELHITWAVEAPYAGLVRDHHAIDQVVVFPPFAWRNVVDPGWHSGLRDSLEELRKRPYDAVVDLQGLMKSSLIALAAGSDLRIGVQPQREGARLVSRAVPLPHDGLHAVDRYLKAAEFLGALAMPADFALPLRDEVEATLTRRLATKGIAANTRLVVVNPTTARAEKNWPATHWAEVIDQLPAAATVVLIGSDSERVAQRSLLARTSRLPIDLTGETKLVDLIALLNRCAVHIAGDTGTLHIAAALGRPVVGIYGPTDPEHHGPYNQPDSVLYKSGVCGTTCPRWCLKRRACLRAITPDDVVAHASRALAQSMNAQAPLSSARHAST